MSDIIIAEENNRRKKYILIIAAYVIFVLAAALQIYFNIKGMIYQYNNASDFSTFKLVRTAIYLIINFVCLLPCSFIFFNLVFLKKSISRPVKTYIWVFIIIYLFIAASDMDIILRQPFRRFSYWVFNFSAGGTALLAMLSIVFLRYDNDNSKIARFFNNNWFIIILLSFMALSLMADLWDELYWYIKAASSSAFFKMWSHTMDSDFMQYFRNPFPILLFASLVSYIASLIVFILAAKNKKPINKVSQIIIICTIALLAFCFLQSIADSYEEIDYDESIIGLFIFWEYYALIRIILFISLYIKLPKQALKMV